MSATPGFCIPKNRYDQKALTQSCIINSANGRLIIFLCFSPILHAAIPIKTNKIFQTIGKIIFGGLNSGFCNDWYHSPGLNCEPINPANIHSVIQNIKLNHFITIYLPKNFADVYMSAYDAKAVIQHS